MRKKCVTVDCVNCEHMSIGDNSELLCSWGKGKKPKLLEPQKGKRPLNCRLVKV